MLKPVIVTAGWVLHVWRYYVWDTAPSGIRSDGGRWRTRYTNGELTRNMTYGEACNLAEIFGGTVERAPRRR